MVQTECLVVPSAPRPHLQLTRIRTTRKEASRLLPPQASTTPRAGYSQARQRLQLPIKSSEPNKLDNNLETSIKVNQAEEIKLENDNKTRVLEPELDYLVNMRVYIKNAYTGKYLDVSGGSIENGANVQQYEFNGTNAQKWGLYSYGDGNYTIVSELNSDGTHYNRVLDVSNGLNGENINAVSYTHLTLPTT